MSKSKPGSSKRVIGRIKLEVPAGQANPAPPVGAVLGQRGVNIMEFCKAFNDATKTMRGIIPVKIQVYHDKSFTFKVGKPKATYLIKEAANLKKGAKEPGKEIKGRITKEKLMGIAEEKMQDMNAFTIESAYKMLKGTALSMGIEVLEA